MKNRTTLSVVLAVLLLVSPAMQAGNLIQDPNFNIPVACPGGSSFKAPYGNYPAGQWFTSLLGSNLKGGTTNINNNYLHKIETTDVPGKAPSAGEQGFVTQCIENVTSGTYEFGAYVQVNPQSLATPVASVQLFLYTGTDCTGAQTVGPTITESQSTSGALVKLAGPVTVASNVNSVLFDMVATFNQSTALQSVFFDDAFMTSPGDCQDGPTTLCLRDGRFKVEAAFETDKGATGNASAVPFTNDTGMFWFFSPDNTELIVKVVDACVDPYNRYWVFASGLTDVEVNLTVTDTEKNSSVPYTNPQKQAFQPIQDTTSFATCP